MNKFKQFINKNYLLGQIKSSYQYVLSLLSKHKSFPLFLSHGGIHFFAFALIFVFVVWMANSIWNNKVASFNQIVYTFYGDSLHNYRLNHLRFEKDMTRRQNYIVNEGDIKLKYGYVKDTSVITTKHIMPAEGVGPKDSCDLYSVLKYVTCNKTPDTLMGKKVRCYKLINGYQKIKWKTNHERKYIVWAAVKDSLHLINQRTDAVDKTIEWESINPYFSFWIGINMPDGTCLDEKSYIKIKINDIGFENSEKGIENPMIVEKVIPQPTKIDINSIVFKGKELQNVIRQKGIYVSGVDTIKKEEAEHEYIRDSVLLGTFLAILFDIFIQLILKWRKLKKRNK